MRPAVPGTGVDRGTAEAYADDLLLRFGEEDDGFEFLLDEEFGSDDENDEDDDENDEDDDEEEGFGGLSSWPSRVRSADRERMGKIPVLHGIASGVGKTVSSSAGLAASVGQGLAGSGWNPWMPAPPITLEIPAPAQPVQVVADRQSLPPVYVADPTLASEAKASPSIESEAVLAPTAKFGASFQQGSVKPRRGTSKEAVLHARFGSEKQLREAAPEAPAPLVEDGGASPVLLDDGTLADPQHGRLCFVSCFSCSSLPAARYGATGNGCIVCDDYGAILVPSSDLSSVAGTESYGFLAALISAITPLAGTAAQIGGGAVGAQKQAHAQEASARAGKVYQRLLAQLQPAPAPAETEGEKKTETVSGLEGWLGGLDDLEDLDQEEDLEGVEEGLEDMSEAFGADEDEDGDEDDDDLDFLDDDDPFPEDEDEAEDLSSQGRIVRVLFPRGRVS